MMMAQRLYEAGYITYMRTDSTNLSAEAVENCRAYIETTYGKQYLPEKPWSIPAKKAPKRPTKPSAPPKLPACPANWPIWTRCRTPLRLNLAAICRLPNATGAIYQHQRDRRSQGYPTARQGPRGEVRRLFKSAARCCKKTTKVYCPT